jgi:hypothetical protein
MKGISVILIVVGALVCSEVEGSVRGNTGGLISLSLDKSDQENLKKRSRLTYDRVDRGEPLNINDNIALSQSGISDAKIIELIQKTDSHYYITSSQTYRMRKAGVSERLINFMAQT